VKGRNRWYTLPIMTELKRPARKLYTKPLTDEDRWNFLPYKPQDIDYLPKDAPDYTSDMRAVKALEALRSGQKLEDKNFSGYNFKGADLSGLDLSGADFSKTNLTGVDFSKSDLKKVDFSYAYMEGTNFSEADLTEAVFKGVFFKNCCLDGAIIDEKTKTYLGSLEWLIEQIEKGLLDIGFLTPEDLLFVDLRLIDFSRVDISGMDLSGFDLTGVNLSGVYVDKKHLAGMEFMEKMKERREQLEKKTLKEQVVLSERLAYERKEKIEAYAREEFSKQQHPRGTASSFTRPPRKEMPYRVSEKATVKPDETKGGKVHTTDEPVIQRMPSDLTNNTGIQVLSKQPQDVKLETTNLKKRT